MMERQVKEGLFIVVDGPGGTDYIPADVLTAEYDTHTVPWHILRDYCEENGFSDSREVRVSSEYGFGARFSAPGYLDCSPWEVYETEREAVDSLTDDESTG